MATGYKNDLDEKQAADARYNPQNLHKREQSDDGFDDIAKNYDQTADDRQENDNIDKAKSKNDPNENIDSAKKAEENPMNSKVTEGGRKQPFNLKSFARKKGPLAGLIALLGGGGILITSFTAPAMLLVQITDIFTNNFNDAHTALSVRSRVAIAGKINSTKNSFSETKDGKCGIRCKSTTMSDAMVRNLEAKGYKVTPDSANAKFGRRVVHTMILPNGTVIRNGNEFKQAMKDPINAAEFNRVFNSKTRYFLNSKFGSMLKSKLGIDKAYKLAGESKAKFNESFRRAVGLPPATTVDPNAPLPADEERVRANPRLAATLTTIGRLSGRPTNAVAGACLAYNANRGISATIKVAKYSAYAAFAMTFLNAAHKLKAGDGGGIDPLVVSELGDRITYTDTNQMKDGKPNEAYGLSATDSYGYKAAAYGDNGAIPNYAKANSMESAGIVGTLVALSFFTSGDATARNVASTACRGADSPIALAAQCAPSLAGTPFAFAGCVFANLAIGFVIGEVVATIAPFIITEIVKANLLPLDENTKGVQLGDALYPGSSAILGGHAASYGMKTGTKEEIKNYIALGNDIRQQDEAIAKIDAKETPFDIYNQYSFLGSMARSVNIAALANSSLSNSASVITSTIPRSLASLATPTKAGTYMPINENKVNQYKDTDCVALNAIKVAGDAYCMPAYTKSEKELNADSEANLTYMIDGLYVNEETGEPNAETPQGKDFQKFLDYCPFRVDAMGETSQPIQGGDLGDYEWYIGARCNEDSEMVENFRIYAMDEPVNAEINGEETALHASSGTTDVDPSTGEEGTDENSGNVTPDGWSFPTTPNAPLVSPFGQRGGGFHTGIDLGVPSGSPFYATRDGTVQTREYNVYSIAGGSWCPVLGSMTDPNQKDIWITHDVNGTIYTSVYAHMSRFLKRTGDVVKAGDLIGYTGGSGCSSGPHVHFEIWQGKATPSVPGPGMRNPWPLINP
jgi:hypothetical protein